jgi:hypothetical protein
MWEGMMREFGQEAEQAKAALVEVGRSVMMELVRKMVPEIAKSLGVNLSAQPGNDQGSSQRRETSKPAYGAATGSRFTTTP